MILNLLIEIGDEKLNYKNFIETDNWEKISKELGGTFIESYLGQPSRIIFKYKNWSIYFDRHRGKGRSNILDFYSRVRVPLKKKEAFRFSINTSVQEELFNSVANLNKYRCKFGEYYIASNSKEFSDEILNQKFIDEFIHNERGLNIRTENLIFSGTKKDETILYFERRVHLNKKNDIKKWLVFVQDTIEFLENYGYVSTDKADKILINTDSLKHD